MSHLRQSDTRHIQRAEESSGRPNSAVKIIILITRHDKKVLNIMENNQSALAANPVTCLQKGTWLKIS